MMFDQSKGVMKCVCVLAEVSRNLEKIMVVTTHEAMVSMVISSLMLNDRCRLVQLFHRDTSISGFIATDCKTPTGCFSFIAGPSEVIL